MIILYMVSLLPLTLGEYHIAGYGQFCSDSKTRITNVATCKAAAATLGFTWGQSWWGPWDFPGCLHTKDSRNKVYFNLSPHASSDSSIQPNYAEICTGGVSGLDSIFEKLWTSQETITLRNKAVNSYLIQNLISGKLDPRLFTKFIINDLYYLSRVGEHYTTAITKTNSKDKELLEALKERLKSANNFADFSYKYWGIVPDYGEKFVEPVEKSKIKAYVDYQIIISKTENPYFTLVVNLPCSYLWCWLGFYMQKQAKCNENIYCKSIADIFSSNKKNINECSTKLISYVNTLGKDEDFDKIKKIFLNAMQFELDDFLWVNKDLA